MSVTDAAESNDCLVDTWDDTLLIKAYDDSVKLARGELARRISLSTSKKTDTEQKDNKNTVNITRHQVGDYVRATYEDGVDYEAKIVSINESSETCLLKYIGYENVQEVPMRELIPSWGKKVRRLQFAKAKLDAETEDAVNTCTSSASKTTKNKTRLHKQSMPPPPPIPPMLTASQNAEDSEHLSAMLMSWYMSGYYTGVYQGMQMAKSSPKAKK